MTRESDRASDAASVHGGQGRGLRRKDSDGRALCGRCGAPYDGFTVHGPGACERAAAEETSSPSQLADELDRLAGRTAFHNYGGGWRATLRDSAAMLRRAVLLPSEQANYFEPYCPCCGLTPDQVQALDV